MGILFSKTSKKGTQNRSNLDLIKKRKIEPNKKLTFGRHSAKGRNHRGVITSRHRGGGHKNLYRQIDFRRDKKNIIGKVWSIEYDPNRNSYICLVNYKDGEKKYILHVKGMRIGDIIISSSEAPVSYGNALPLTNMPLGTILHNVELLPDKGGKLVRAAGTVAKLIAKEGKLATIRLPSGEIRLIPQKCLATVGQVGNVDIINQRKGKAGSIRWIGKRPKVRGVAMNPVDHPHGGGEGRTPIGRKKPLTPWGYTALGERTRRKTKYSNIFILRRRRKN
uniref:Large ribosomal subunit protein uL2c n=2 Tax=Equisetum TaxID=3257 RepID=E3T2Q4_EQUAR|nr:ribosomal protein L2 [Equisetum arvense]ADA63542.1 ribosomal protein L2 [Equisetum arvense]